MGSRLPFGAIFKDEEIRFKNNLLELFTSHDPVNWWQSSKQSLAIVSDIMGDVIKNCAENLYDNYLNAKMSGHIIKASFELTDNLLMNQFQEFDVNQEVYEPQLIEEDDEPVVFLL